MMMRLRLLRVAYVLILLIAGCAGRDALLEKSALPLRADLLPEPISTEGEDFAPVPESSGGLVFSSTRSGAALLYRTQNRNGEWTAPERVDIPGILNAGAASEGTSTDLLFVQCYHPAGLGDCDLWSWSGKSTDAPVPLGLPINSLDWDSHPTRSADGHTLIFASEREGGEGGSDLWMTVRNAKGEWSVPTPLGRSVNTSGDEKSPWLTADGTRLYFSSNGYRGLGGFDILVSQKKQGGWSTPKLLPEPINSEADDVFYAQGDGDTAFVASNRRGGRKGLDLYCIAPIPRSSSPSPVAPRLVVRAFNAFTRIPISGRMTAMVNEEEVMIPVSIASGASMPLSRYDRIQARMESEGFRSVSFLHRGDSATDVVQERDLYLIPETDEQKSIFSFTVEFDFDRSTIRDAERRNLDSAAALLSRFPGSVIRFEGHTDSLGTDEYNMELGRRRADAVSARVQRYLDEAGVLRNFTMRIESAGESHPITTNATDEGRQRNRRVVITIIRNE